MVTGAEPPDTPESGLIRYSNVALDVSSGQLLTLQGADDHAVQEMKLRCSSLEVRCPVDDCEAPELSATVGYVRKNGTPVTAYFSHKAGGGDGGHGPEGYARAQIKRAISDWAVGLGFDAAVDLWVPEAGRKADVAIDGTSNLALPRFAVDVQGPSITGTEWAERNQSFHRAGMEPRSLWMAPGGSCPGSFDLRHVGGQYEDLHDVWFAGIDGDGQVKLAMGSGFPTFTYETAGGLAGPTSDVPIELPIRCQPLWRDLADITLDEKGFVDQALRNLIQVNTSPDRWSSADPITPLVAARSRQPLEGQLFATEERDIGFGGVGQATDRSSWSPEEHAKPGTRWMRDLLHDRRHEAFLAGVPPQLID